MAKTTRRDFLKATTGAAAAAALGQSGLLHAQPARRTAVDWVTLGNSGVKVTRLAFGTGTHGGRVQRSLGQEEFTRLVRYAYDRGIRFFESADAYSQMHGMLAEALRGIPRDSYRLMTKMRMRPNETPMQMLDRFRRETNSEYFDIVLVHAVRTADWAQINEPLRDALSEAKEKKIVLAHGASVHGLLPLRSCPGNRWLDVTLLRINHDGTRMDNLESNSPEKGDVPQVVSLMEKIHAQGTGVLGMKLMGEGRFQSAEERDKSIRFVTGLKSVDAFTIGFKSTAEIDEAIERINRHLNA